MALDLKHELELLVDALGNEAVSFALCGGVAVTIHGAPRLTDDLDLLVPPGEVGAAKRVAATVGFDLPAAAPMVFGAGTAGERVVHASPRRTEKSSSHST